MSKTPEIDNDHLYVANNVTVDNSQAFQELRNSLLSDIKNMLTQFESNIAEKQSQKENLADDTLSLSASIYKLPEERSSERSLPGIISPETETPPSEDEFSDLIVTKNDHSRVNINTDKDLNLCHEILSEIDKELPEEIEYGTEIPERLADRDISQFLRKSQNSESRKLITQRHKLPSNCKDVCVPKLHESVMTMQSFSEYLKRTERSYFNTQNTVLQATSCVVDILKETLLAEEKSEVIDIKKIAPK